MGFNVSGNTNTYDYMNSFFDGLNGPSNSGSTTGPTSLLGDWYAVQNGSYHKLAKKYFASEDASFQSQDTTKKELELVKEGTQDVVNSLNRLMDEDLYKKVEKTDEDGNTYYEYNTDAILDTLKTYIEDYNSLIEHSGELEDTDTLKAGVRLVNQAEVYQGALARVGITIKSDNQMEIDEEAFKKAEMTDVKSLFTGGVSYGKNMQTKFLNMYTQAANNSSSVKGLYSASAQPISTSSMFDSLM